MRLNLSHVYSYTICRLSQFAVSETIIGHRRHAFFNRTMTPWVILVMYFTLINCTLYYILSGNYIYIILVKFYSNLPVVSEMIKIWNLKDGRTPWWKMPRWGGEQRYLDLEYKITDLNLILPISCPNVMHPIVSKWFDFTDNIFRLRLFWNNGYWYENITQLSKIM